jgi:hypothetical protein
MSRVALWRSLKENGATVRDLRRLETSPATAFLAR